MSTKAGQLMAAIQGGLDAVDERYPGYRQDLTRSLAEIVMLERANKDHKIDIRIRVKDQCAAAADLLHRKAADSTGSRGTTK